MELVARCTSLAAAGLTILVGEGAAQRLPGTKALDSLRFLPPTLSCPQWGPMPAQAVDTLLHQASPALLPGDSKPAQQPGPLVASMLSVWPSGKGIQRLYSPNQTATGGGAGWGGGWCPPSHHKPYQEQKLKV